MHSARRIILVAIIVVLASCMLYVIGRALYTYVVFGGDVHNPVRKEIAPQGTLLCRAAFANTSGPAGHTGSVGPVVVLFERPEGQDYYADDQYRLPGGFSGTTSVSFKNTTLDPEKVQALACVRYVAGPDVYYTGGGINASLARADWDVRLVRWPDGALLSTQYFEGEPPPPTVNTQYGWQPVPPARAFAAWLEALAE